MPSVHPVTDARDPALWEYRELTSPEARARIEGDVVFLVEGPTAIARAQASRYHLRSLLISDTKWAAHAAEFTDPDLRVYVAPAALLEEVVGFRLHRGMIAAADRVPLPDAAGLCAALGPGPRGLLVAEGLNDPENLGAIARSARAFGMDGLLVDPTCIDPFYRRTVRVSMGEILHLPVGRASRWPADLAHLRAAGFGVWALTPSSEAEVIWDVDLPERVALLVGAEGPGLAASTLAAADRCVRIPIAAGVDSLNVGAATAVACAEVARRRRLRRRD